MYHRRTGWKSALAVGLIATLLSVLLGCSTGQPVSSTPPSNHGVAGSTIGGAVPTATWSIQCTAQALPQGWTWYQDTRYPFHLAVPPTWRTGTFEYIPDGSGLDASPSRIHVVDLFGPESQGQAESSGKMRSDTSPPVITLEVGVGQQTRSDDFASGRFPNFHAQPAPACVGGIPVTQYQFTNDEGDVERVAVLSPGPQGYPYTFTVASHASTTTRDIALFLTVLSTFSPLATS